MYVVSFISDAFPRVFRFRAHGLLALVIIAVGLGICALIGFWAGKVAQGKGREFSVFFALGFLLTICGIVPGLIVVIIAYALRPVPAPGQAAAGATPPPGKPPPGHQTEAPPPQPPIPPARAAAPVTPSPQGGYEYVPPPAAASTDVPPPSTQPPPAPPPPGPESGGPGPPPPPPSPAQ